MILLSSIIKTFGLSFVTQYEESLLPSHRKALAAMRICRTTQSPKMLVACTDCDHQRKMYDLMIQCGWSTLKTFSQNDTQLQGVPGAIAVLHTHSRRLDFHPHVHVVIPAGAIDREKRLWRTKKGKKPYLFNHTALARVFRARMLEAINREELSLPEECPDKWVVDCKFVGSGSKALVYLGRYLYRGVIQEKDIIACENGKVTFRYTNSKTEQTELRTLTGEAFLGFPFKTGQS